MKLDKETLGALNADVTPDVARVALYFGGMQAGIPLSQLVAKVEPTVAPSNRIS